MKKVKFDTWVLLVILFILIPGVVLKTEGWTYLPRLISQYLVFSIGMIMGANLVTRDEKIAEWWAKHIKKYPEWTWRP